MADDKLGDETALAEEGAAGKSKKSSPIIIYLIIAVIMAVGGYFAGTRLTGSSTKEPEAAKSEEHKGEEAKKPAGVSEVYMMQDIIVNPSGTGGTRFLSVSIGFDVGSKETLALLEKREPVIKDALITILGSKTIEQLSDAKQKEITRYQIKKRTEQLLQINDLQAVYFTDFILQ
nr:flagellar basal body-associated FliL family protein [candidate division Zixibacteria bacterium]